MKKYLLPKDGCFYKANLHTHTYLSDGSNTPEEIKKEYIKRGYSVVAFTDHDILIPHNDLTDDKFLALNGCEIEVNENDDVLWREMKTMHMNCIALEPDNHYQVCYNPDKYLYANAVNQKDILVVDDSKPLYEREYSHKGVSKMMDEARNSGFFVIYNHPAGSMEYYPDYIGYNGMHAMEIINSADMYGGYFGYNPQAYDDLLRAGKKIFCVAGHDTHSIFDDLFVGWTMIKAEKLEYRAITDALIKGHTYVSQGPVIDELWFENGELHITTPGVDKIVFTVGNRRENKVIRSQNNELVTEASYTIKSDQSYIRVTLYDDMGNAANTNAYFVADLLN